MDRRLNQIDATIEREALDWTKRSRRADFADWDALTDWLVADPRHAEQFHAFSLLDEEVATALRLMPVQSVPLVARPPVSENRYLSPVGEWAKPGTGSRRILLAASITFAVAIGAGWIERGRLWPASSQQGETQIATGVDERREVVLTSGTRVALAPRTQLSFDRSGHRVVLGSGEARFDVRHDPVHPFAVQMGHVTVTDVGTVFDLRHQTDLDEIAVTRGAVQVTSPAGRYAVSAGQHLQFGGDGRPLISPLDAGERRPGGSFSYTNAPVADVAADIARSTETKITVSPAVAGRRFSGTIHVQPDAGQDLHDLAPLLGVAVRPRQGGWVLVSRNDATAN